MASSTCVGVERGLGVGVAHVALGADGFNFFEVVHDLSFRSMGATSGDLPGRERCVRRPALRAAPRPWSNSIVQVID